MTTVTTTSPESTKHTSAAAAAGITVVAWASAFVAIRALGDAFDPGALALGRLLVGALALGTVLAMRRGWVPPTRREWALLGMCGVAWFGVYNVALNAAEQRLDAGTTSMLVNVGPILIAVMAGALLGEGFPRWLIVGAVVAFGGAALIGLATSRAGWIIPSARHRAVALTGAGANALRHLLGRDLQPLVAAASPHSAG